MIGFFPDPYPDELVYSMLARYYDHAGYLVYRCAAEELFVNHTCRPNPEFVNLYTDDALRCITHNISMEEVILHHTMLSAFRFLPAERLQRAFQSLVKMGTDYCNTLPLPTNEKGQKRYLRYCPICVKEDRAAYGECYWHRMHQIIGVNICPEHRCYLIESPVTVNATGSPSLTSAESVVRDMDPFVAPNPRDTALAKYTQLVFDAPMDMQSDVVVGDFLSSRLEGTRYVTTRGGHRNMVLFQRDYLEFYEGHQAQYLTETWQFEKVFCNQMLGLNEICMMAFFLGINASDLCDMQPPEKTQVELFDAQVQALHDSGLSYPKIAARLNAKLETVKCAGEGKYCGNDTERRRISRKGGCHPKDWEAIDAEMLPRVQTLIKTMQGDGKTKPRRVTISAVERLLPLSGGSLSNMPTCLNAVKQSITSQEEHWARLVEWAIKRVREEGRILNWKSIRVLTNMRKSYLLACAPYLGAEAKQIIESILPDVPQTFSATLD